MTAATHQQKDQNSAREKENQLIQKAILIGSRGVIPRRHLGLGGHRTRLADDKVHQSARPLRLTSASLACGRARELRLTVDGAM